MSSDGVYHKRFRVGRHELDLFSRIMEGNPAPVYLIVATISQRKLTVPKWVFGKNLKTLVESLAPRMSCKPSDIGSHILGDELKLHKVSMAFVKDILDSKAAQPAWNAFSGPPPNSPFAAAMEEERRLQRATITQHYQFDEAGMF
jgi:hypothetical protein